MRRIGYATALIVCGLMGAGAAGAMTLTSSEIKAGGKIAWGRTKFLVDNGLSPALTRRVQISIWSAKRNRRPSCPTHLTSTVF